MEKNQTTFTPQKVLKRMLPGFLLALLVFLVLAFLGDLQETLNKLETFNWSIFPVVLLFTLFNYSLRFIKWHFYIGQLGIKDFPVKESARLFVAGFPLAMTPGKVGEILKGVWLNQLTGLPVAKGVSAIVAERISDGMGVLLLSTLGVIAYPQYWPAFLAIFILLAGVILASQIRPLAMWLLDLTEKIPVINKTTPALREFYEGSFSVFRPRATMIAVGLGVISWMGEGIGFYLILKELGLPVGWQTLSNAIFILAFSTVIGAVSALPGGLGAAEASIAGMLTLLVGVSSSTASVATLLIRLATLWFGILLGVIAWLFSMDLLGFRERLAKDAVED